MTAPFLNRGSESFPSPKLLSSPMQIAGAGRNTALMFSCLSVCLSAPGPHPLQPACSRPSWWITSESRSTASKCFRKKARTSRRSIDREWRFTTWVTSTRPSTTWKRQDPASRQVWGGERGCGFALSTSAFLFRRLSVSLSWLPWFPQGWAWLTVSLAVLPFRHALLVQQGCSAQRLTTAEAGRWHYCWNAICVEGILPLFPSLVYFWRRKEEWQEHILTITFSDSENKLLPLSKVRTLFVISNSRAFHHPSKGWVLKFDQRDRHLLTYSSRMLQLLPWNQPSVCHPRVKTQQFILGQQRSYIFKQLSLARATTFMLTYPTSEGR